MTGPAINVCRMACTPFAIGTYTGTSKFTLINAPCKCACTNMAAHSTCIDSVIPKLLWVGLLYITRHTDAKCHKKAVSIRALKAVVLELCPLL